MRGKGKEWKRACERDGLSGHVDLVGKRGALCFSWASPRREEGEGELAGSGRCSATGPARHEGEGGHDAGQRREMEGE